MTNAPAHCPVTAEIRELARVHASRLAAATAQRKHEMLSDDCTHHFMYGALGVSPAEGRLIDEYQNVGRFLYKSAGSLMEQAALMCFKLVAPDAGQLRLPNATGSRPKSYQVDCLLGLDAIELKWRDATTDGDHVAKEQAKLRTVVAAGYRPVRLSFFEPSRLQARRIQASLAALYVELGGLYLAGAPAWEYVKNRTGVDLWHALTTAQEPVV